MAGGRSPTVRRRRLGIELRRLREAAGLDLEAAGRRLERTGATVSRIELGRVSVRVRDVEALLDLYQVTDEQTREALLAIARDSRQKGWWHAYGDVLPAWFEVYLGLEAAATSIRTYEVQLIPGLLQTEAYARAVLRAGLDTSEEIERQVALRMARQSILSAADPPHVWAVLDEAVLRRQLGGPSVMREQLHHLIEASEPQHVTLQVLPFTAGGHAALLGAFVLLAFEATDPPVVYMEYPTGSLYLEKTGEASRYTLIFDHLRAMALSPQQSRALIATTAEDF